MSARRPAPKAEAAKVQRLTARRAKADPARRAEIEQEWRSAIVEAVHAGGSLREVAAIAGCSHQAVKFMVSGRPSRAKP